MFFKDIKVPSQKVVTSNFFFFTFLAAGLFLKYCPTRILSVELFWSEEEHHQTCMEGHRARDPVKP